jgi:hypothetical protein
MEIRHTMYKGYLTKNNNFKKSGSVDIWNMNEPNNTRFSICGQIDEIFYVCT